LIKFSFRMNLLKAAGLLMYRFRPEIFGF